jgi:Bacterial Ig domain
MPRSILGLRRYPPKNESAQALLALLYTYRTLVKGFRLATYLRMKSASRFRKALVLLLGMVVIVLLSISYRSHWHQPSKAAVSWNPALEQLYTMSVETQRYPLNDPRTQGNGTKSAASVRMYEHSEEAPAWVVRYGKEFWRQPVVNDSRVSRTQSPRSALEVSSSVNVGDVIERISHRFETAEAGTPQVKTKSYSARVEADGLRFLLTQAPEDPSGSVEPQSQTASGITKVSRGEAVFRTVSIWQGESNLYAPEQSALQWSIVGNTAQALLEPNCGLIEHCEARSKGVEVAWVFTARPLGTGPLTIESEVCGVNYTGQTENGYHFADKDGMLRFCVGKARIVDVQGRTWDVSFDASQDRIVAVVPDEILNEASYPLAIDPLISPEFPMDELAAIFPEQPIFGYAPTVAWNGENYFVAWTEAGLAQPGRTFAARVSGTGALLDPWGIKITEASGVAAAANGRDFLLVWSKSSPEHDVDIYATRISGEGVILDANPITVCSITNFQVNPAVASDGTNYFVVWQDARNSPPAGSANQFIRYDVYGARMNRDGVVIDTNGIPISVGTHLHGPPVVAVNRGGYLVAWYDSRNSEGTNFNTFTNIDIYAARINGQGVLLDPDAVRLTRAPGRHVSPVVASNGTNWLIGWLGLALSNHAAISFSRVSAEGVVLDPNPILLPSADVYGYAAVGSAGGDYLLAWHDSLSGDIRATKISGDGAIEGTSRVAAAHTSLNSVAMAASQTGYLIVWPYSFDSAYYDIVGSLVNSEGMAASTNLIFVTAAGNYEANPKVAFDGSNYLVVWEDQRNSAYPSFLNNSDIYGARISPSGESLDPKGIAICSASGIQSHPAVAGNSKGFLVVWEDLRNYSGAGCAICPNCVYCSDVYGTAVTSSGQVAETNGILIATTAASPAVAAGQEDFFAVWESQPNHVVSGALLSDSAEVKQHLFMSSDAARCYRCAPAIAGNGSIYLIAWTDTATNGDLGFNIYGTRVSGSGAWLDSAPIPICTKPWYQDNPAVASNGRDFFVAWVDDRNFATPGGPMDIYGARVAESGSVLDPDGIRLTPSRTFLFNPAIASDGSQYLVGWFGYFEGLVPAIYGVRVRNDGNLLDQPPFMVKKNGNLALASGGATLLMASTAGGFNTSRVFGSLVVLDEPPVAVSETISVNEDTPLTIVLAAADTDGDSLTYGIVNPPHHGTLTGTPPHITYLGFTNYNGPDSFTFKANDGRLDSDIGTITITVLPVNDPPIAIAHAFPVTVLSSNDTAGFVISVNNVDAVVRFDGSESYDIENDPLQLLWFKDGQTDAFAAGIIVSNSLDVGLHEIVFLVSDGFAQTTNRLVVNVLTAAESVQKLEEILSREMISQKAARPLFASLDGSIDAFDRANSIGGLNQLNVFINKVRTQLSGSQTQTLAYQLIEAAQKIIDCFRQ